MPPRKKVVEPAAPPSEDVSMEEAPAITAEEEDEKSDDEYNPASLSGANQIKILEGSSETAASFSFKNEDHTLGNALRYIIMKNPDVEFCGYSIPHPSEAVMNIRIQTYKGTALEALEKGFDDLEGLCEVVADAFTQARAAYVKE